jgi:uncharacterized membrane protein YphA (DoxX/SURF4 family)
MDIVASPAAVARPAFRPWVWWVGTFAAAFLGLVLLVAVWAKMLDPEAFAEQITAEGLDVLFSARVTALLALFLEAGLGVALLLGVRRLWLLVPGAVLVAFLLFLTGRTYWLDAHGLLSKSSSCGCFGNLVQRTPAEAFWQDLALLVPALVLSFFGRDRTRRPPKVRVAIALAVAAAVAGFAWWAPQLPLDDLATRLRPGAAIVELCVGRAEEAVCLDRVAPELATGDHLVVMGNLDDPALTAAIPALNQRAEAGASVVLLSASAPELHQRFFWQWGPAFAVREAPAEVLRPLYRRLPRSFEVHGGRVAATFAGLPPMVTPRPKP